MRKTDRYRYVTPTSTGRWRGTQEEARFAAAKAGHGSISNGRVYLDVLVEIESEAGKVIK